MSENESKEIAITYNRSIVMLVFQQQKNIFKIKSCCNLKHIKNGFKFICNDWNETQ